MKRRQAHDHDLSEEQPQFPPRPLALHLLRQDRKALRAAIIDKRTHNNDERVRVKCAPNYGESSQVPIFPDVGTIGIRIFVKEIPLSRPRQDLPTGSVDRHNDKLRFTLDVRR